MKAMLLACLAAVADVVCACRVLSAPEAAPAIPQNSRIIAGSPPTLAWDAVAGAKAYKVFCFCSWAEWPALDDDETSSTCIDCCCEGYFTASAVNSGGESAKADPPVLYGAPAAPLNVRIDNSGSLSYLRWDAVLGAESYAIYYAHPLSHPDPSKKIELASIPMLYVTQYVLTTTGNDYWVAAVAPGGESDIVENVEIAYH